MLSKLRGASGSELVTPPCLLYTHRRAPLLFQRTTCACSAVVGYTYTQAKEPGGGGGLQTENPLSLFPFPMRPTVGLIHFLPPPPPPLPLLANATHERTEGERAFIDPPSPRLLSPLRGVHLIFMTAENRKRRRRRTRHWDGRTERLRGEEEEEEEAGILSPHFSAAFFCPLIR